jgi:hypothetical protein
LVNKVPRNEDFFLDFVGCVLADMPKECTVGDLDTEEREDKEVKTDRPGDGRPLSTSEGEVMTVEVVTIVFVVGAVPFVLVECRHPAGKLSGNWEFRYARRGTWT